MALSAKYAAFETDTDGSDAKKEYQMLRQVVTGAAEEVLPQKPKALKQDWKTTEILDLMDERRKVKHGTD